MNYRIALTDSIPPQFYIICPDGALAYTQDEHVFITRDRARAEAALMYLDGGRTNGKPWVRMMFGDAAGNKS